MRKSLTLIYGVVSYSIFFGVFLYAIGFVGNLFVPKTIDSGSAGPLGMAIVIDLALVLLFGLQHTIMARPTFKEWWTKFVPEPIERATYVLFSSLAFIVLFIAWQPIDITVWNIQAPVARAILTGLFLSGWLIVLATTFLINHFDLFGLRQVWVYFRGREYTPIGFITPGIYKHIRHPLYVGWLTAFWATPTMTAAHLTFAVGMAAYILIAIYFEERNLVEFFGERYATYRKNTPMFIPKIFGKATQTAKIAAANRNF